MPKCYKNNFLKEVIIRIDFLNPIKELQESINPKLAKEAIKYFPLSEPIEHIGRQFQLSPDKAESYDFKIREWNFFGKEKEKRLTIKDSFMYISFFHYESFEDLILHFTPFCDLLFEMYSDLQITRIGLRYINNIELPNRNVLNWKGYLNKNLLSIFDVTNDKAKISRALSLVELNYDKFNIRFQYGMHNPDYPSIIKKKIFIIDTDVNASGLMTKSDLLELLPTFRTEATSLFENSIMDKMRSVLNEE